MTTVQELEKTVIAVSQSVSLSVSPVEPNTRLVVAGRLMAPRRSGKVRENGQQVSNNLAAAHADGVHHHHNIQTKSKYSQTPTSIFSLGLFYIVHLTL